MAFDSLSKSSLMAWRQCPKRLWLQVYQPDRSVAGNQAGQKFMIGNDVGEFARSQFPTGILIEESAVGAAADATAKVIKACPGQTIFEATYVCDGLAVRAGLLVPTADGYRLIEVKSGTGVKPHHLDDCAIQAWVLRKNGIKLGSVELAHIDSDFVYQRDGCYGSLLSYRQLDSELPPLIDEVPKWLDAARQLLAGEEPGARMGEHCESPFECPFKPYCSASNGVATAAEYPLETFYRMRASCRQALRAQGYEDVRDVPEGVLNDVQRRIQ